MRSLAMAGPAVHDRRMRTKPTIRANEQGVPVLGPGCAAAIVATVALAFSRGLSGGFVYDDLTLLAQNPALHDATDYTTIWTAPLWGEQLGHWRPLTAQLFAFSWSLTPGSALGIHAVALVLHVLAAIAAARIALSLTLPRAFAVLGALLFALHPANAETVGWCASLNDALLCACSIGALDQWLRWRITGAKSALAAAHVLAAAAMLAKEAGALTPVLLLATDVVLGRTKLVARSAPTLLLLVVAWLVARTLVFGDLAAGFDRTTFTHPGSTLANAASVGTGLLRRLALPLRADMFEGPAHVGMISFAIALALVAALAAFAWRRGPAGRVACVLIGTSLLPPILAVQNLGPYPVADRYLALATVGLGLAIANGAARHGATVRGTMCALVAIYAIATWIRLPHWHDQETFISRSLAARPDEPRLHLMRGTLLLERAQSGDAAAIEPATTALQNAKRLLGDELVRQDELASLRRDVAVALAWTSMFATSPSGQPDWARVEREFLFVTANWPDRADAWVGLGVARAASGQLEAGIRDLQHAVQLDPGAPAARFNLAKVLHLEGSLQGAEEQLREALRIRPGDPQASALLEEVLRQRQRR